MVYKKYKADLEKKLDVHRKQYFQNLMDMRLNSIRNIWKAINNICSFTPQSKRARISRLTTDQGSITDCRDIASTFSRYFAKIGINLAARIDQIPNGFREFLPRSNPNSIFLEPASKNEILNTISSLNKSNATGTDGMITRVLNFAAEFIAAPLMHIVNMSFSQGVFPSSLKVQRLSLFIRKEKLML